MAVCVVIHATGVTAMLRRARLHASGRPRPWRLIWLFVRLAGWIVFLHLIEIAVWAAYYVWQEAMPDFQTAAYFSAVTYTTTGYGDLVLSPGVAAGRRHRGPHRHPDVRVVHGVLFRDRQPDSHGGRETARFHIMTSLLNALRTNPMVWLLVFVPVLFIAEAMDPEAHTRLFVLSVLAIVPLAGLLSHATESVAARTGDTVGGLLNATLGNLTELVIALAALRAGQYLLVKASIAGAIVTNSLFMLGASFLLGGLKYHVQTFNRESARLQASLLFLATIALLVPSTVRVADPEAASQFTQQLSVALACMLIIAYGLGMLFSLRTHRELFAAAEHGHDEEQPWPIGVALGTLAVVTVLVALVSEVFVESVQQAAETFGMTPAFVGFIVVALVGAAAEMASAFSGALKNRLDLSVGIALGSASQIALFVAPMLVLLSYVLGPAPMDLRFWTGAVVMMLIATFTASLVTNGGHSAWFVGVLVLMVYLIFAMTLYLLPPAEATG